MFSNNNNNIFFILPNWGVVLIIVLWWGQDCAWIAYLNIEPVKLGLAQICRLVPLCVGLMCFSKKYWASLAVENVYVVFPESQDESHLRFSLGISPSCRSPSVSAVRHSGLVRCWSSSKPPIPLRGEQFAIRLQNCGFVQSYTELRCG